MTDRPAENPFNIAATPEPTEGRGRSMTEADFLADPAERVRAMVGSLMFFFLSRERRSARCAVSRQTPSP